MRKNNKKEKGAALINVMLVVLLAVAIGLPLLYLVVVNFTFRMFDNNLRSISYRNEMGMDNVYAIIQEIVIEETNIAKNEATNIVDNQVKGEQDSYKAWVTDGRKSIDAGDDGVLGTDDDELSSEDDLDKLKGYLLEHNVITQEEYDDDDFEVKLRYIDITDGSIMSEEVKKAYSEYFTTYYKTNMDTRDGSFKDKLQARASSAYGMVDNIENLSDTYPYALGIPRYDKFFITETGTERENTEIDVKVTYRGKSDATNKYIKSDVAATFTIGVPDFDSASSINQMTVQISNPLLDKTLVVGNAINIKEGKNLSIIGNTTVSGEGVEEGQAVVTIGENSSFNMDGRLAVNGDINMIGGKSEATGYTINTQGDVLCNEIKISGTDTKTNINGTLYIADDMEFSKNNTNMTIGTFMGFNADPNDSQKNSAILFNDKEAGFNIDSVELDIGTAYIAGTSFLGDIGYRTGESISVRGNYRAYQALMKEDALTNLLDDYSRYSSDKIVFSNYNGVALATDYIQVNADGSIEKIPMAPDMDKSKYFYAYYKLKDTVGAFLTSIPQPVLPSMKVGEWKWSTGVYYDSAKADNDKWQLSTGSDDDYAMITNAEKDYEKHTKYFGYGEGYEHRELDGNIPVVVGESGWIDSDKLIAATKAKDEEGNKKYEGFDESDEVVVLLSEGNITLTDRINGKKGIIIAGGNIIIQDEVTFEGTLICGGELIVNNNFTLKNNSIAVNKIMESAVSTNDKELFEIFRDDESGNMYTYSTIDSQIASINMNDLIKISNWEKSKFSI